MKGSDFILDGVNFLYYKFHKINSKRGTSYIESLDWMEKNKKGTMNPKNKDNRYFQYAVTVALSFDKIKKRPTNSFKY